MPYFFNPNGPDEEDLLVKPVAPIKPVGARKKSSQQDLDALDISNTEQEDPLNLAARQNQLDARKRKLVDFMRQQGAGPSGGSMVGGQWIAPSAGQAVVNAAAGYEAREMDQQQLQQEVTQRAALRDSLSKLSGVEGRAEIPPNLVMQSEQDQAGVPGIQAVAPASGADRRKVIADLMDNPAGGRIGSELLKDDLLEAPRRAEVAATRASESALAREAKKEAQLAELAQRAEAAKQRSEDARASIEQRREAAQERADLMRELAAGRQAAGRAAGGGQGQGRAPMGFRWTEDGGLEPIPGGPADPTTKANKPVNLTAAQQKAYDDSDVLLGHIDNAMAGIKANPNALGYKTVIPDMALSKLDPEGVQTRAAVAGLSAERVHQLSGAAVSPAEFSRLRPYLPASGDTAAEASKKLTSLRGEVERIKAAHARGPTRANPGATAPAPTWDSTKEQRYQDWKARNGK